MLKSLLCALALLPVQTAYSSEGATLSYERFIRLNTPSKQTSATNWFGLNLDLERFDTRWGGKIDTDIRFFNSENRDNLNYSLSEAYVSFKENNSSWTLGRKILDVNPSEKYWQLGTINGQQGFKLLSEKQEGLIGLHYQYKPKTGFRYSAFLSYVYLPKLNPGISIKNGEVTSTSEWRKLPPTRTRINGQIVDIYYELEQPSISDIVFQKAFGATLEYSWGSGKVSSYAFYKPENNIRSNAEAFYDLNSEKVMVTAKPIVNHHAALGMSVHQKVGNIRLISGIDVIDPNAKLGKDFEILNPLELKEQNKNFDSEYFKIQPSYDRESYFHAQAVIDRFYYSFSFNYIQLVTDNIRKADDFFSDSVKFKRAVGGQVQLSVTDRWSMMFDLKYDLDRKDNIARGETLYKLGQQASLGMGIEMIKAPDDNSYWSPYRANDTVYTSFGYHF